MKWLTLTIDTSDIGLEIVSAALDAVGISAVEHVESHRQAMDFLNRSALYWDFADESLIGAEVPQVIAYLPDLPESEETIARARAAIEGLPALVPDLALGTLAIRTSLGDDVDWENNWKRYYKPIESGEKLLILPDWEEAPPTARAIVRLDPGVAFGTGGHHTTRMCLELLEQAIRPGDRVLDLGCGSGILGLAALRLGASSVTAVDIDPLAAKATTENAERNGLSDNIRVFSGNLLEDEALRAKLSGQYDLVLANIVAEVILRMAPFARACCKSGAHFITSGIIGERRAELLAALAGAGFTVLETRESGDWVAALLRA